MSEVRDTGTASYLQLETFATMLPSVVPDTSQNNALLENLVSSEGFAARAKDVNPHRADVSEELFSKEPEVWT